MEENLDSEEDEWTGGMRGPQRWLLCFLRKWCVIKSLLRKSSGKNHRQWGIAILPSCFSGGRGQCACAVLHTLLVPAEWNSISHRWCYGLNVGPPAPHLDAEILTPKVKEFGGGVSGRWLGDESAFINVISALIKAVLENSITLSAMWGCSEKTAI